MMMTTNSDGSIYINSDVELTPSECWEQQTKIPDAVKRRVDRAARGEDGEQKKRCVISNLAVSDVLYAHCLPRSTKNTVVSHS